MGSGGHAQGPVITVSFIRKDGSAYGLPLSLASAENGRVWYFHCAQEGEEMKYGRME